MPDESSPKSNKKLTENEAARQVMQETVLFAYQKAFSVAKERDPVFTETIKPQFDEFMRTVEAMIKEDPDTIPSIYLVERRLPNNPWVAMIKKSLEASLPLKESKEQTLEKLREQIKKRMEGKDIH